MNFQNQDKIQQQNAFPEKDASEDFTYLATLTPFRSVFQQFIFSSILFSYLLIISLRWSLFHSWKDLRLKFPIFNNRIFKIDRCPINSISAGANMRFDCSYRSCSVIKWLITGDLHVEDLLSLSIIKIPLSLLINPVLILNFKIQIMSFSSSPIHYIAISVELRLFRMREKIR
jgi:hypothetical protein